MSSFSAADLKFASDAGCKPCFVLIEKIDFGSLENSLKRPSDVSSAPLKKRRV